MKLRILGFALIAAAAATPSHAQQLRRALAAADVLLVGEQVRASEHGEEVVLHHVRVVEVLRGAEPAPGEVVVLDFPKLSFHQRPVPGERRLYCLHDHGTAARRMGLPDDGGPYYKMSGFHDSHPPVGDDLESDPVVAFARIMVRAEGGTPPEETALELYRIALEGAPAVRTEAAKLLAERQALRAELTQVHWSALATKVAGVAGDVPYKIALAELCAVGGVEGLVEALVVSFGTVTDAEYARAVGRIARHVLGDNAIGPFQERLAGTRRSEERTAILRAMGATDTPAALQALLRMHSLDPDDKAVAAGLSEHGSPRAKEALQDK